MILHVIHIFPHVHTHYMMSIYSHSHRSFLVLIKDALDLLELDEFVDRLEGDLCVILDGAEVDHLVHVVGRDGPCDFLAFLVIPDFVVFLEGAFVELVEKGEGAGLVDFEPLFVVLGLRFLFAYFDVVGLVGAADFLLFYFGVGGNVDTVGIQFGRLIVLRLETGLAEQALELVGGSE